HAYTREGHGPAQVMTRVNGWLTELNADPGIALFATCCFVVINPSSGRMTVCRAGHPPPVLLAPGSAPRIVDCDAGLPLGIDADADYSPVESRGPLGTWVDPRLASRVVGVGVDAERQPGVTVDDPRRRPWCQEHRRRMPGPADGHPPAAGVDHHEAAG